LAGPLFSLLLAGYRYSGISIAPISLRHVSRRPPSSPTVHSITDRGMAFSALYALRYQSADLCLVICWLEDLQKDKDCAHLFDYRHQ
jgi:hypothetical protein